MALLDWTEKSADVLQQGGVIGPDERLPWPQTAAMGVQHVIAMFGATVLAPILMGFDPNIAILMSGIGTLIFFVVTGGKVPSYLGSSFAFIGVVITATAYAGKGPNANIGVALGGIIACGAAIAVIGLVVQMIGVGWIEKFMPPVVTGAVVAVIGLNLAGIPIKNMAPTPFDAWMQAVTFVCVGLVAVYTSGLVQRLLILVGLIHLGRGESDPFGALAARARTLAVCALPALEAELDARKEPLLESAPADRRPQPALSDQVPKRVAKRSLGEVHARLPMPDLAGRFCAPRGAGASSELGTWPASTAWARAWLRRVR